MAMLSFSCPILCWSMWAGDAVKNSMFFKMFGECLKFTSLVRLKVYNFLVELSFYVMLKINKNLENITLKLQRI